MELLAFLSKDDIIISNVKKILKKFTVYPLNSVEELEDLYTNIPINLLFIDTRSRKLSSVEDILGKLDEDMVVLITSEKPDKDTIESFPKSVYECLDIDLIDTELSPVVERAIEKQRLKNELSMLRKTKSDSLSVQDSPYSSAEIDMFSGRDQFLSGKDIQEKVLINFAKMLTASFDMRKLFSHFMDSVKEIVRVSKMSVMLRDKEGFYVKTYNGLDPYIAEKLRLEKDSAIAMWLARTGKIRHKPVNPVDVNSINIKREMDFLQCTLSFPIIYKGKLIGIFNINNKITEEPFYKEELEMIYTFCNYLAAAIKDIDIYHKIWYQKEFTKNILTCMNSGMVAIDRNEKITVFNQQASEFLKLDASEIIGSDLRNLPSPLGDILYETMIDDTSYKRHEAEIRPEGMPIGINSFRLIDENQNPTGAGIVFTDLSDSKKLEDQERRAEKLETVNNLMAKIAHEVRTPLTSIQTYTQVMSERHKDDEEMQNFFSKTVIKSIQDLDTLIDKLVIFSCKNEYNFSRENINDVISGAAEFISKNIPEGFKVLTQGTDRSVYLSADRKLLIKAFYYIVQSIVERAKEGILITIDSRVIMRGAPSVEISVQHEGPELTEEERQNLLRPLEDIKSLGSELNVPISHKIIESHNGTFDIKSENGTNAFIINLPGIDRRAPGVHIEEEQIERKQR